MSLSSVRRSSCSATNSTCMPPQQSPKRGSNNLWQQLLADLPDTGQLDPKSGIWGDVRPKPAGVWKEARQETVSLADARQRKTNLWGEANEETLLLPRAGRGNVFREVERQLASPPTSQPVEDANLWEALGDETVVLPRVKRSLPKFRPLSSVKPIRASGWALKELATAEGETYWVLKNIQRGNYLRLNEQQVYFWQQMDGEHSLKDLAVAMFVEYGTLAIDGLMDFIVQLRRGGFLVDEGAVDLYQAARDQIERRSVVYHLKRIGNSLIRAEFSFKNMDQFYSLFYRLAGRVVFSSPFIGLLAVISILGLPAYAVLALRGELLLLGNANSTLLGLVTLWIAQLFAFFTHESAHALTTKHYGRTVRRGGVGLYLGLPAFFVDTTDIWMEPRGPRILVTWAGPMAGFVLGGITSLALLFSPTTVWAGFGFQFATFCMVGSVINLNPLIRYDGYFMLMDWLEMPMLREKSLRYVRQDFLKRLGGGRGLTREERIYAVYGVGAALFTAVTIISVIILYGKHILGFISWISSMLP